MSKYWTRWAMRKQAGKALTPEQLSKYMEDPVHCPVCDRDNISTDDTLFMSSFDEAKKIHCETCGSRWVEDWSLTGAGDLEVRKLVKPEEEEAMWEGQWQKRAEENREFLEEALMDAFFGVLKKFGVKSTGLGWDEAFWDGDLGTKYKEAENLLIDIYLQLKKQMGSDFEKQWS